jgi:hypothetical protein
MFIFIHSSTAGSPNSTVSLTKHCLFTVLPKTFLTVRHVLSVTALCREQGVDEQFTGGTVQAVCLE